MEPDDDQGVRDVTGRRGAVSGVVLLLPLLVLGIGWLYFFAGAYYGIYIVQVRISSVVIAVVVLLVWLVAGWRSDRWRPASSIWPALAVALGALALSTVTSRNPRISLDFLVYAVLLAGLYLLLRALLANPAIRERIGAILVILTATLSVAYLATVSAHWWAWWGLVGRISVPPLRPLFEGLTYGNPGAVAAMAVLSWLGAAGHLGGRGRMQTWVLVILGLLVLAVVVVSGTRGSWLAVGSTGVVAAALFLARPGRGTLLRAAMRDTARRIGLVVAGLAILAIAIEIGPYLLDRALNSGEGGRPSYWAAAIRMFVDAPLTGVGPGMWAPERIRYTMAPDLDYYIPHAHNVYLQTGAELGIVGLVAGAAAVLVVGRLLIAALRGPDAERRRWATIAVLGAVYFGTHQLTDVFANMPAALFVFALPFAWLDATVERREPELATTPRVRRAAPAIFAVLLLFCLGWNAWSERSALDLDTALTAADRGGWPAAVVAAEAAVRSDPSLAPNQLVFAIAAARVGRTAEAEAAFAQASALDDLPTAWLDLAWLRLSRGDGPDARLALDQALRLGGQQPAIAIAAGFVFERLGDTASADHWYTVAVGMLPRLGGDPFWQDPARAARWPAIRDSVVGSLAPADQADLWLTAGDAARASEAAGRIADPDERRVVQLGIAAWGGDANAQQELRTLAVQSPRDMEVVGWCARLAARSHDFTAAAAYRTWLVTLIPQTDPLGLEVQVVDDTAPGAPLAGVTWEPYGIYTYRRPVSPNQLLPGLPHLQLSLDPAVSP